MTEITHSFETCMFVCSEINLKALGSKLVIGVLDKLHVKSTISHS
jgi:hypothetical protein